MTFEELNELTEQGDFYLVLEEDVYRVWCYWDNYRNDNLPWGNGLAVESKDPEVVWNWLDRWNRWENGGGGDEPARVVELGGWEADESHWKIMHENFVRSVGSWGRRGGR